MKVKKSAQLILLGIAAGLAAEEEPTYMRYLPLKVQFQNDDPPQIPVGSIAEMSIQSGLTDSSRYLYHNMDQEGRDLVFHFLHGDCKGQNECKGMNSCRQEGKNACAGMASCKGTASAHFENSDLAVKVASKKLAENQLENKTEAAPLPSSQDG